MIKNITNTLKIITLASFLSLGISFAYAWSGPTTPPPPDPTSKNVPAPINVSNVTQTKTGSLNIIGNFNTEGGLSAGKVPGDSYATTPQVGCKAGYTPKYKTTSRTCRGSGNSTPTCSVSNCTTGGHDWSYTNSSVESCQYTSARLNNKCVTETCSASQSVMCEQGYVPGFTVGDSGGVYSKGSINNAGNISSGGSINATGGISSRGSINADNTIFSNYGFDPNYDYGQTYLTKWGMINPTGNIYIEPASGKNIYLTPMDWVTGGEFRSKFATNYFEGAVHAPDFYITKIGKWASELTSSTASGLSSVTHDSTLLGDGTVGSPLSVSPDVSKVRQVIAKADASGNFIWTEVVNSVLSQASALGAVDTGWHNVYLSSENPVLGVKMSGSTDEGGLCIVNLPGYFSAALSRAYDVTTLGLDGSYTLGSWGGSFGDFTAGEWIFEETKSGFHVEPPLTALSQTRVAYNKPVGLNFIPLANKVPLSYRQIYSNTNGPGGNTCKVSVLYGSIVQ